MRLLSYGLGAAALLLVSGGAAGGAYAADGEPGSFRIKDPRITESSGLAAARAHPGVFWTHNDSDDGPYVYAVDSATGKTVATVTLRGIQPRDVEAVSVGPDGQVYVADIGDNLGGTWPEVWIYRFPEPKTLRDTTVDPVRYTVRYDGGPRDAESLAVHPKTGRVYIVSKHKKGGGLYEGPARLSSSGPNTFRRVADIGLWATDAAFSPDGSRLLVRGYFEARAYRWRDGAPEPIDRRPPMPFQIQGESVAFTPGGRALMYGSEGANSQVVREELDGELLPDSVASEEKRETAPPAGRHGGPSDDGPDGTTGSASGGEQDRNLVVGALTFAAATVLALGIGRLFRRRG
ncbi:hypothetical protein AB0C51_12155 [Streptomyces pathocidini]|uniref:hypothetical protein n=1 Tax=Streptomyces pathocidini TaxID=1650571 RepID=UPI0033E4F3B8